MLIVALNFVVLMAALLKNFLKMHTTEIATEFVVGFGSGHSQEFPCA